MKINYCSNFTLCLLHLQDFKVPKGISPSLMTTEYFIVWMPHNLIRALHMALFYIFAIVNDTVINYLFSHHFAASIFLR